MTGLIREWIDFIKEKPDEKLACGKDIRKLNERLDRIEKLLKSYNPSNKVEAKA